MPNQAIKRRSRRRIPPGRPGGAVNGCYALADASRISRTQILVHVLTVNPDTFDAEDIRIKPDNAVLPTEGVKGVQGAHIHPAAACITTMETAVLVTIPDLTAEACTIRFVGSMQGWVSDSLMINAPAILDLPPHI